MDAKVSDMIKRRQENASGAPPLPTPAAVAVRKKREVVRKARQKAQVRSKKRLRDRELIKAGMTSSLTVAILTGIKVLKPMRLHPVAAWIFLGITVAHMVTNSKPSSR
ncbi:MAG: hypothetical protein HQL50_12180 [Magnetococcales bacterium]|nr:hypothetical protein [Magnetococcales bacterium]